MVTKIYEDKVSLGRAAAEQTAAPVDIAFVGIGENGHLAFNDPPADFKTEEPYIIVELDEPCRRQQVGEGWFNSLSDVPKRAISMSVRQILKAKEILVVVPDTRKAQAVKSCIEGPISPLAPASTLREVDGPHWHAAWVEPDGAGVLTGVDSYSAGQRFLRFRCVPLLAGGGRIGKLARRDKSGLGMVSKA